MTSSPLFIREAESMVIFFPISQWDGVRASLTVTSWSLARGRWRKGPSGCGEDEAMDFLLLVAQEGLKDGAVFAVDRQDLDMVLFGLLHQDLSRHDQRFLIGQGDRSSRS